MAMTHPGAPLRVAFCVDNLNIGGTELNAVRTAEMLTARGVELRVFTLSESGPLLDRYHALGVPVTALPISSLYGASAIRQGRRLRTLLREERIDVLHAHDLYTNIFAAPWARLAGVGLITSRRWLVGPSRRLMWLANRQAYALAGGVLANSPAIGAHLVERERVPAHKVTVINNFIEPTAFEPPPPGSTAAFAAELDLPADRLVVGVLASLRPVKDHATLLRAAALVADAHPLMHVVIVGADYGAGAALESLASVPALAGRVRFAGLRPSRPTPHHFFDISALTSRSEGFPNSLLEAMAAGRPVVATRVGGIPDVVLDGVTGFLTEPGDVRAIADRLDRLLGDPALRARMGAAGRARAATHYSVDAAIDGLLALYRAVARRNGATSA
jgi:glycosyltransferase involved in cell wall biosynthesis